MISRPVLERLIELACLAPSVHNTQPWVWQAGGRHVRLYADRTRLLPEEDPLGRNLTISCGAALDHFRVAAHALGLASQVVRLPQGPESDLLAEIELVPEAPSPTAAEDIALLRARCTDRRRFTSWPVPRAALDDLARQAAARGARACPITDDAVRFRLEVLARRAQLSRALDVAATSEQRRWVGRPGPDGIPVAVLPADPGPAAARFAGGSVAETRAVVESSDGVIAIGAPSDDPDAWLRTGEGLSALWLRATRDGLSVVPLSLPIEIETVRGALQDELGGLMTPHLLARIGWQAIGRSELPRTPRRDVTEVLRD